MYSRHPSQSLRVVCDSLKFGIVRKILPVWFQKFAIEGCIALPSPNVHRWPNYHMFGRNGHVFEHLQSNGAVKSRMSPRRLSSTGEAPAMELLLPNRPRVGRVPCRRSPILQQRKFSLDNIIEFAQNTCGSCWNKERKSCRLVHFCWIGARSRINLSTLV